MTEVPTGEEPAQLAEVTKVAEKYEFLQGDTAERIAGLRRMSADELMFLSAGINSAVLEQEWASGAPGSMGLEALVTLEDGQEVKATSVVMPVSADRTELFMYAKQIIDVVIDANPGDLDDTNMITASLWAKAIIAIHPFPEGNGRTGRGLFYLLSGQTEGLKSGLSSGERETLGFEPYDAYAVKKFVYLQLDSDRAWRVGKLDDSLQRELPISDVEVRHAQRGREWSFTHQAGADFETAWFCSAWA